MAARENRVEFTLLQCFRAAAILFVLLGHVSGLFYRSFGYDWFHIASWNRTGGVDFFFVLSGFMIAYLYGVTAGKHEKAKPFLIKRLKRIYPLYFLVTFLSVLLLFVFPSLGSDQERNPAVIIQSLLLWPSEPILSVTWSLQHIAFFYIVFACYIAKPQLMKIVISVWMAMSLLMEAGLLPLLHHFLFSFSNVEILSGCLAAVIFKRFKLKGIWFFLIGAGLAGYLAVWTNNVHGLVDLNEPYFYCVFSFLLIIGIAAADKEKARQAPKTMVYLGAASYSIYIAHGPIAQLYILLFRKLELDVLLGHFVSLSAVIVLTILSSCLVYEYVEKPLAAAVSHKRIRSVVLVKRVS